MRDKLRNIGPKSAAWLRQVGIHQRADLEARGALDAYILIRRAGFKPSLNLLYALEGALLGCHWQALPLDRREQLSAAASEACGELPGPRGGRQPEPGPVTLIEPDDRDPGA